MLGEERVTLKSRGLKRIEKWAVYQLEKTTGNRDEKETGGKSEGVGKKNS